MNNGTSFKFNFETDNPEIAQSLLAQAVEKVTTLFHTGNFYRSVELNLFKPGADKKTACLTMHTHDSVVREESREEDWEHAVDMVFQQAEATNEHAIKLD